MRKVRVTPGSCPCPKCGLVSKNVHSRGTRTLKELGVLGPTVLLVTYNKFYCKKCLKYYSADMSYLAPPASRYTSRARRAFIEYALEQGPGVWSRSSGSGLTLKKHFISAPMSTVFEWLQDDMSERRKVGDRK